MATEAAPESCSSGNGEAVGGMTTHCVFDPELVVEHPVEPVVEEDKLRETVLGAADEKVRGVGVAVHVPVDEDHLGESLRHESRHVATLELRERRAVLIRTNQKYTGANNRSRTPRQRRAFASVTETPSMNSIVRTLLLVLALSTCVRQQDISPPP